MLFHRHPVWDWCPVLMFLVQLFRIYVVGLDVGFFVGGWEVCEKTVPVDFFT